MKTLARLTAEFAAHALLAAFFLYVLLGWLVV